MFYVFCCVLKIGLILYLSLAWNPWSSSFSPLRAGIAGTDHHARVFDVVLLFFMTQDLTVAQPDLELQMNRPEAPHLEASFTFRFLFL